MKIHLSKLGNKITVTAMLGKARIMTTTKKGTLFRFDL